MNHIDKTRLQELLSAYIDDELPRHRRRQVEELIEQDEKIAGELRFLQRQKHMLGALPVASAPADMLDRIKAAVEAGTTSRRTGAVEAVEVSSRGLYLRRQLLSAAMILLPVGVLAWVVWSILMPLSAPPGGNEPVVAVHKEGMPIDAISFPLSASLYLTTPQVVSMGDFIQKAVYRHGLVSYTSTIGIGDTSKTYEITAGREQIVELLADLAGVWDKCRSTSLTVHGRTISASASIDNVRPDQAIALYQADIFDDPLELADSFDRLNRLMADMPGYGIIERDSIMRIERPVTTSDISGDRSGQQDSAGNATLFITITAP